MEKLYEHMYKGKTGWDDKKYEEGMKECLRGCVENNDYLDAANYAIFLWNLRNN